MGIRAIDRENNVISMVNIGDNAQAPSELLERLSQLQQAGCDDFNLFKAEIGIEGTNPRISASETCYLLSYSEAYSNDVLVTACNFSQTLSEYAVQVLSKVTQASEIRESKNRASEKVVIDNWEICFS